MKQSDIFSILIIATVGTIISYFVVNSFLGNPDLQYANIKTISAISPDLAEPDSELFNPSAINPTVEVYVGECQDIDGNGILSREELIKCGKIVEENDSSEQAIYHCPDGTAVTDLSICNQLELEEQESLNNTTNSSRSTTGV